MAYIEKTKEQICLELGLDALIDDDAKNLELIHSSNLRVILFKNGLMGDIKFKNGVESMRSWEEIVQKII